MIAKITIVTFDDNIWLNVSLFAAIGFYRNIYI